MEKRRIGSFFAALILALGIFAGTAHADKASVALEIPDEVAKGTEVTMTFHVTHSANSFLHHTNWLRVKINGEEIRNWEYSSMNNLPPGAKFTKEIKLLINEPTEVEAQANCNLHGSKGPTIKKILLK
jgi:desulfoferrodoxin (superoxide reductase-like protein)